MAQLNFRKDMSATRVVPTAIIVPFSARIARAAALHDCYSTPHVFPVALMDTMQTILLIVLHAQIIVKYAIPQVSAFLVYLDISS